MGSNFWEAEEFQFVNDYPDFTSFIGTSNNLFHTLKKLINFFSAQFLSPDLSGRNPDSSDLSGRIGTIRQ